MYQAKLRDQLIAHFSESELQNLCFDLGVAYENLPGKTHADKARELIAHCRRHGLLDALITHCQKLRPHVSWTLEPQSQPNQDDAPNNQQVRPVSLRNIMVGLLALVGVGAMMVIVIKALTPAPTSLPTLDFSATAVDSSSVGTNLSTDTCFDQFLEGIPQERITFLEDGVDDFAVISADQSQAEEIGLVFTAFNQPAGAMRLTPFPNNNIFKITAVADESCRNVDDFLDFNEFPRGVVGNGEDIFLHFGTSAEYFFSVYYYEFAQEKSIKASFWALTQ